MNAIVVKPLRFLIFGYENSIRAFMGRFVVESVISFGGSDGEILRL
ncbi:hypothetical protein GGR08_001192, partial [Bartonella fuyuanensis]|nr:hypothetical protein [Bartonella fuyuanensis]